MMLETKLVAEVGVTTIQLKTMMIYNRMVATVDVNNAHRN